jgi:hypothetical protein
MEYHQLLALITSVLLHAEAGKSVAAWDEKTIQRHVRTAKLIVETAAAEQGPR